MRFKILLSFLILQSNLLVIAHAKAFKRAEFGEHCNSTVKCDNRAWLSCQEDRCQCIFPDEMEYDLTKKKCLSKAGERCKFQISNMDTDSGLLSLYDQTDCVGNANCGIDGLCICESGFYETFNGSCATQKPYNENCTMDSECSQENFLSCINSNCGCGSAQIENNGVCFGKAGMILTGKFCITGSILVNNTFCVCSPAEEYYAGEDGKCHKKKDYEAICSSNEECSSETFLKCEGGACGCGADRVYIPYSVLPGPILKTSCEEYFSNNITGLGLALNSKCSAEQVLCKNLKCIPKSYLCDDTNGDCAGGEDEDQRLCYSCVSGNGQISTPDPRELRFRGRCVGLASQPCNPDTECVTSAHCSGGFCNCNDGSIYKPSTRTCGASHRESCSKTQDCGDNFLCKEGTCSCPSNDQTFDATQTNEKCLNLIHGSCDANDDCISNAQCKASPYKPYKECQCGAGYVENQKRSCDLAHGAPCEYGEENQVECDQLAKLVCINKKCSCQSILSQYDPVERKCLGLDGTPCPDYPNSTKLCVENAVCQSSHPDLQPICTCSPGFNSTENRFCVKDEMINLI